LAGRAQSSDEYRTIFESLYGTPRIHVKFLSKAMKLRPSTTSKKMRKARDMGYIVGPHLKRKSFANFPEYVYFLDCKDPLELYLQYSEDQDIVYHAGMDGFSNLWVISKKEIEVDGLLYGGRRSDYYLSFPPDCSWDDSIKNMWHMLQQFNPEEYIPQNLIQTHWDQYVAWNDIDETLFREFKYDLRKPLTPLMKKYYIFSEEINEWLERLPQYCTIATYYFPESMAAYDPYLFMFETDYEDFIIGLFSQLPTTSFFFKAANRLFAHVLMNRQYLRNTSSGIDDVNQLHIPLMIRELKKRRIVKNHARALVAYHCRKDL
jgi:hypothetical protein